MNKAFVAIFVALCGMSGPAAASAETQRKPANEEARNAIAAVTLFPQGAPSAEFQGGLVFPGEGALYGVDLKKPINRHGTSARVLLGAMLARYDERPGPGSGETQWNQTMALLPVGLDQKLLSLALPVKGRAAVEIVPRVGAGVAPLGVSCTGKSNPSKSKDCHRATWTVIPYLSSGADLKVKNLTVGFDYDRFFDTSSKKTLEYQGLRLGLAFDGAVLKEK